MPRSTTLFVCQQCAARYAKWSGRCDNCGAWNSLVEEVAAPTKKAVVDRSAGRRLETADLKTVSAEADDKRLSTGLKEFDEVLGGGLVPGSVSLLAGQPGIGKSTLLMQVTGNLGRTQPVLYVSGEESSAQVAGRAKRLGVAGSAKQLELSASTSADDIAATIASGDYRVVVVDSMQTLSLAEVASAPGTVSQITNSANIIIRAAKAAKTAVILVGHVTKEGSVAGPKVLEHLVDVVLGFEGDRYGGLKLLRAAKNRYGSTAEVALFDMDDTGLKSVDNPSASLLKERSDADGSVILATMEGNRPLLVEIQALVNPTSFGYPKRTASGFDLNRLNVLVAVLEKRTKLKLSDKDIFINVVGGLKLQDPAADLAVAMAIASASAGRRLDDGLVVFGEIGLGGEVRSVRSLDARVKEAKKLGFKSAIGPQSGKQATFVSSVVDLRQALIKHLN
ncbi:MAG TPA: DNA repair protein RadA [Candidatus Saccharimonadales bacterium]|nr:DNA repair protein RadA [Candidatus Saccharimonadales bacterium]